MAAAAGGEPFVILRPQVEESFHWKRKEPSLQTKSADWFALRMTGKPGSAQTRAAIATPLRESSVEDGFLC
ncbi:MAG: hypothetical protein MJ141_07275 [Clostridia bacterium]|nr:hypothetical protein [Clostridia bacterium]